MQQQSFYWHDYETFGLSRDEFFPAQFAGRRTSLDLEPLDGGDVLYCRPAPDLLPAPGACLLTGILPQHCEERGLPEPEFAAEVLRRLGAPGTIGIGYNTLAFDDEVTRFLFWRNFIPAYEREYMNECGRWDLFPVTHAVWALRPEGIEWPKWKDCVAPLNAKRLLPVEAPENLESFCFKLECLTAANGISHAKAHDALSDVEGTIALARLIREKQPRFWTWAFAHRGKDAVREELSGESALWVDSRAGQERGYLRCVRLLAGDAANKNAAYLWDLSHDPEELFSVSAEEIRERAFRRAEDLPAGKERLPLSKITVNKCPVVCGDLRVLRDARAEEFGIDKAAVKRNAAKFTPALQREAAAKISEAFSREWQEASRAGEPKPDADAALYDAGFPGWGDKAAMKTVTALSPSGLEEAIHSGKLRFEMPVLRELLFRYVGRNCPECFNEKERAKWRRFAAERVASKLPAYEAEITRLEAALEGRGAELIRALREWPKRPGTDF